MLTGTNSVLAETGLGGPLLAIVISKTSFTHHWGVTQMAAHGWGGIVNLAGIPYRCFFIEDLAGQKNLENYRCHRYPQPFSQNQSGNE